MQKLPDIVRHLAGPFTLQSRPCLSFACSRRSAEGSRQSPTGVSQTLSLRSPFRHFGMPSARLCIPPTTRGRLSHSLSTTQRRIEFARHYLLPVTYDRLRYRNGALVLSVCTPRPGTMSSMQRHASPIDRPRTHRPIETDGYLTSSGVREDPLSRKGVFLRFVYHSGTSPLLLRRLTLLLSRIV
ncbi:hypothetical protein BV25DRAFT_397775 [Artomyces pyxidatus]|uniref:Uncharacterized protein n=1 Tax=Artomyces pyxidatus TaxID=48021 RepID=A0ACB8T4K0_9AGAM|nr:hypothetical protein BV25DRAFT_397775 [Artomyces pyxidatus]